MGSRLVLRLRSRQWLSDHRYSINNIYIYIGTKFYAEFSEDKIKTLYDIKKDPNLKLNLSKDKVVEKDSIEDIMKAYIQTYNYRFIHNELTIEKK